MLELEQTTEVTDTESLSPSTESQETPSVVDIGSLEKFKFEGKEWTPADLKSAYMRHSDYTKKTTALAEERKYYDNLADDLANVKSNPQLLEQFKQIYPEKFHRYLDYVVAKEEARQERIEQDQQQKQQYAQLDPEIMKDLQQWKSDMKERQVQAATAEIDAVMSKNATKFPLADEEAVLARAQLLQSQGTKLTPQVWEGIYKSIHGKVKTLMDKNRSTEIKEQNKLTSQGRDIGAGGGVPGAAPKLPKSIKEASSNLLRDLE